LLLAQAAVLIVATKESEGDYLRADGRLVVKIAYPTQTYSHIRNLGFSYWCKRPPSKSPSNRAIETQTSQIIRRRPCRSYAIYPNHKEALELLVKDSRPLRCQQINWSHKKALVSRKDLSSENFKWREISADYIRHRAILGFKGPSEKMKTQLSLKKAPELSSDMALRTHELKIFTQKF
jgi:hypothetical protein